MNLNMHPAIELVKESYLNIEQASLEFLAKKFDDPVIITCVLYSIHTASVDVIMKKFKDNDQFKLFIEALEIERMTK